MLLMMASMRIMIMGPSINIHINITDAHDTKSQKYATILNPIFSESFAAGSWSQYAGIAISARIAYHQPLAVLSRNSMRNVVANVSQKPNINTINIVQ